MADLNDLSIALGEALADTEPIRLAMGLEAKAAAHEAIERSVGADRSLSGMKRRVRFSAGFDLDPYQLNLRPKGLILLADEGRKRTTQILPRRSRRRSGRRAAVMTPQGPRASSTSRPSRGNPIIEPLLRDLSRRLPEAGQKATRELLERKL